MSYFKKQKCEFENPVVIMGTFDGVHLGHQKILQQLIAKAQQVNGQAVVISYYHHPLEIIHKKTFPYLLTECDKKEKLLKQYGADCVLFLDFDHNMAQMDPTEFLEKIILDEVGAKHLIAGYDTHFGKFRQGSYQFLKENEKKYNYQVELVEPFKIHGRIISSSLIRDFVREGDMQDVAQCLGRSYSVSGTIVVGQRIGREIGFPTINVQPDDVNKLLPGIGVYVCDVLLGDETLQGVTNIGYSPTLKTANIKEIETFILDFDRDIYNEHVEIVFHKKLRDELVFKSKEELIEEINNDVTKTRSYFANQ